jgi:hypothetical protein
LGISLSIFVFIHAYWIILLTSNALLLLLHAIPSPPSSFLSYVINPYSTDSKRQNLQHQWPWQQQHHESTTSRLVVGHVDPDLRDLGENATSKIIGATHRRKTQSRKMKNDASKTLDE